MAAKKSGGKNLREVFGENQVTETQIKQSSRIEARRTVAKRCKLLIKEMMECASLAGRTDSEQLALASLHHLGELCADASEVARRLVREQATLETRARGPRVVEASSDRLVDGSSEPELRKDTESPR